MAIINLRVSEETNRKPASLSKARGLSQSEIVETAVAERLVVQEVAGGESITDIPSWVPQGKYVALVRGAVAAVGDSVADVVTATLEKFPDDPIHVARRGGSIKPVQYAFLAQTEMKYSKYLMSANALPWCFRQRSVSDLEVRSGGRRDHRTERFASTTTEKCEQPP
jgi:hypothetical protein